jgi:putative thioredoxin
MSQSNFIVDVTSENFQTAVLEASHQCPVLVDFWASWCGPCKALLPVVEKLANEYQGKFILAKVNIDEQQQLAQQFGVRSVPTVKLVKNGAITDEFMGALPESAVREFLDKHVENEADKALAELKASYQSNPSDETLLALQSLAEQNPDNIHIQQGLAELLLQTNRTVEAAKLLRSLPAAQQVSPEISPLLARLEIMESAENAPAVDELLNRIECDPSDLESRYQLSSQYMLLENYEAALEQLLAILKRDRQFKDDAGRKGMLKVFDILGSQHPLVSDYRKRMTTALF